MAAKMPVRRLVAANVRKVIADLYAPKVERDVPTRGGVQR
jgi:hypothetical protein